MITILVVSGPAERIAGAFARHASVEVLHARDIEDALEKLARNRRIDAVLLLDADTAAAAASAIFEEDPAPPPIYAPESSGPIPNVHAIGGADPVVLIEDLAARLQPGA